jgi:hypothetical protein
VPHKGGGSAACFDLQTVNVVIIHAPLPLSSETRSRTIDVPATSTYTPADN